MGKRGPKPQTDGEKAAAGIVLVPAEIGDCPYYLDGEARAEFHRLKDLTEKSLLGATDRSLLIRYCAQWGQWIELQKDAGNQPPVISGENGSRVNPFWTLYQKASRDLLAAEDKLGLTPACRARLTVDVNAEQEDQTDEEFFGQ